MSEEHVNPYAPPKYVDPYAAAAGGIAEGESTAAETGFPLHGFRQRSVLLMLLLTIVTLGLYINYWVHRQAAIINQKAGRAKVSMGLVGLFWAISVASLLWIPVEVTMLDDPRPEQIGDILDRADMIAALVMAFVVRGELNRLILVPKKHRAWFHGFWTFLFGVYYLQWKINRNLRDPELMTRRPDTTPHVSFDFVPGGNVGS